MSSCPYSDDEDEVEPLYENGHWVWDNRKNQLVFESDLCIAEEDFRKPTPAVLVAIEFRDDLDLMEQVIHVTEQRFRKRFQRKPESDVDVILLQDVKDFALYTASSSVLTPTVINILHLSTTERFIRALILYCQYYLQTADEMSRRMLELETKVRTSQSFKLELELRDNLEDLRLLVAKEYLTMILVGIIYKNLKAIDISLTGGADFRKYHHMGPDKKSRSLSKKDLINFESILRICIQIVWLALGRQSFNQIELEVNRIFKTSLFNMAEHKLKTNYLAKMMPYERFVLLGHCIERGGKLSTRSPLMNEILCDRAMDFRLLGLGTIKFASLSPRLRYMEQALSISERLFETHGITLGILGLLRSRFDPTLQEIRMVTSTSTSSASFRGRSVSRVSRSSMRKSTVVLNQKLYKDIQIPKKKYDTDWLPEEFPAAAVPARSRDSVQRLKWLARAARLAGKQVARRQQNVRSFKSTNTR